MQSHVKQRETFKEEDTSCDMFGITAGAFDPQVVTHKRQVNKFKLCSVHKRVVPGKKISYLHHSSSGRKLRFSGFFVDFLPFL